MTAEPEPTVRFEADSFAAVFIRKANKNIILFFIDIFNYIIQ